MKRLRWTLVFALAGGCLNSVQADGRTIAGAEQASRPPAPPGAAQGSAVPSLEAPVLQRLEIRAGERISVGLRRWLSARGVDLVWEAAGSMPGRIRDVELDSLFIASTQDIPIALAEALGPFGFTAQIMSSGGKTMIVVRNASAAVGN